jgi:hypothetical protein
MGSAVLTRGDKPKVDTAGSFTFVLRKIVRAHAKLFRMRLE